MKERESFEKWLIATEGSGLNLDSGTDGGYKCREWNTAWLAWQARAKLEDR